MPTKKTKTKSASKKPQTATMLFHGFGVTSEEEHDILSRTKTVITLATDDDPDRCFRFDTETGECINDQNDFGCWRTLKL